MTTPLSLIVQCPQRLKVGVVAGGSSLQFVREIKGCQRPHMVKVPCAVVFPAHAWEKTRLDVGAELRDAHAEISNGRNAARLTNHGLAKPVAEIFRDSSLQVFRELLCVIGTRYGQVVLSVLSAPLLFPSELHRVVVSILTATSTALPVSVSDPLLRLFRRVQDATGLAAGSKLGLPLGKRFLPIAPYADVVWASQPGQFWVSIAKFSGAGFR